MSTFRIFLLALLASFGTQTFAADLEKLSQKLFPAYVAMNYDSLCSMDDQWESIRPVGVHGYAVHYAQHEKDEIIGSLTYDESLIVLRSAADAARAEARRQLKDHVLAENKSEEAARLNRWCVESAQKFISGYIARHDLIQPTVR